MKTPVYGKEKYADQPVHLSRLINMFVIHFLDTNIPIVIGSCCNQNSKTSWPQYLSWPMLVLPVCTILKASDEAHNMKFITASGPNQRYFSLYTSFHDLINVYSCRSGQKSLCQQKPLVIRSFATSFKRISLKSDFIQFFS